MSRRPIVIVLLVTALLALAGCHPIAHRDDPAPPPATTSTGIAIPVGSSAAEITSGGRVRTFRIYRPAQLAARAPLVVMLHGGFGDGSGAESAYHWDAEADLGHFLVAYPDGADRAWNTGGGCCGVPGRIGIDDVAFISQLVATVSASVPIDPDRIYATGISNGGMLAYRLACDTHIFAAIGPDSATRVGPCPHPGATSVIHIHGTADHNIPYDGSPGGGLAEIDGPPIADLIAWWRTTDGCHRPSSTTAGVVTTSIATCPDGRSVELITIAGAGHQWPGSVDKVVIRKIMGLDKPSTALDATSVIWAFFASHRKIS